MRGRFGRLHITVAGAVCACLMLLAIGLWASEPDSISAHAPEDSSESQGLAPSAVLTANCRYGFSAGDASALRWLGDQNTGLGWYHDFTTRYSVDHVKGAEYVQTIHVIQDKYGATYSNTYFTYPSLTDGGLGLQIQMNPGALWLVGNEPDRGPNTPGDPNRVQDDTRPAMYAVAYHDIYEYIKQRDSTAQVAIAGLVEVTPGRLQYLDLVWSAYVTRYGVPRMPVDVWNMHLYVLPEAKFDGSAPNEVANVALDTDLALAKREVFSVDLQAKCANPLYYCAADHDDLSEFQAQVIAMRSWMNTKGERNKPLILSEFGILYPNIPDANPYGCWVHDEFGRCFTQPRVSRFLTETFNYLNTATDATLGYPLDGNRLVQQWLWFDVRQPVSGLAGPSNIVTATVPFTFSPVGNAYRTLVSNPANFPQTINLIANRTFLLSAVAGPTQTVVRIAVGVYNNGSIAPSVPVAVTAYADAARTQVIGQGLLRGARGCARKEYFAEIAMTFPPGFSGMTPYWIRVNPGNPIGETTMADNDTLGTVFVPSDTMFIPIIRR